MQLRSKAITDRLLQSQKGAGDPMVAVTKRGEICAGSKS